MASVVDIPLVWPKPVERTARPAVVYLDQNHYINLARCAHSHLQMRHYDILLAAVLRAGADGRAVFPLSTVHIMETAQIGDPRRRRDVADLMEAVSGFATILDRTTLARLEIEAAILDRLGKPQPRDKVSLIGRGVMHAFGRRGGMIVRDENNVDVTAAIRDRVGHEEFDRRVAEDELKLNRSVLGGPEQHDLAELRRRGYAPESNRPITASRLAFEIEFVKMLEDPKHRGLRDHDLRAAVSAREVAHEWIDALNEELTLVGAAMEDVFGPEVTTARAFAESMPSTRVAVSIKTQYHRNPQRKWTTNDVFDIDALSVAVAYCDAAISDKQVWGAIRAGRELEPMNTFLPRTPEEMADWVDRLP